jgi:hypothetical protein
MPPKTIYVIRHCDKPSENIDSCNDIGYKRALLLAGLDGSCDKNLNKCNNICTGTFNGGFWKSIIGNESPISIYAAISKNDKDYNEIKGTQKCTSANRCCLILNPTASLYNKEINSDGALFCDNEGKKMTKYILEQKNNDDGIVIVAWEHKNIPDMINEFGITPKLQDWPKNASDRFDLVFKIDFINNTPKLTIFTQNLGLLGDSNIEPFNYKNNDIIEKNNNNKNNNKNIILIFFIFILLLLFFYIYTKYQKKKKII